MSANEQATVESSRSANNHTEYKNVFPSLGGAPPAANGAAKVKKTASQVRKSMSLIGRAPPRGANKGPEITSSVTIPKKERRVPGNSPHALTEMRKDCQEVARKSNTKISFSVNKDDSVQVIIQGKTAESLASAATLIKSRLAEQGSVDVQIAKQFHRFILGAKGAKLQKLEKDTGTKIRIPGPSDASDTIKISGAKEGVETARREMLSIARKQGESANEKMDIPKAFHPFIRGRKEDIINACGNNVTINVPPPNKFNEDKSEITVISIAGDKNSVKVAVAMVQDIWNRKKTMTEVTIDIPKSQHRHIIGPKGSGIHEIFGRHEVIVDVPHRDSDSHQVTLKGEPQHLAPALNAVYVLANSHATRALAAPSWCRSKIVGQKGANIKDLQAKFPNCRIDIKGEEDKIEVSGPTAELGECAAAVQAQIKDILSNFTVKVVKVPQAFHGRIIGAKGANLKAFQEQYENLNIRLPERECKPEEKNDIRIEGRPEDVATVFHQLAAQAATFENEANEIVQFDQKYHKFFFMRSDANDPNSKDRISIIREHYPDTLNIQFPDRNSESDDVRVRGPKQYVHSSIKEMKSLYQEIVSNNYVGSVLIMKTFHKNIIGKAGQTINKLKEEFKVQIDIPDSSNDSQLIKITGPKAQVDKAKQRMRKMESEHANIKEIEVAIPQNLHRQLIGRQGGQINELRIKYNCVIQFPDKNDKSERVVIRGDADNVKAAEAELSKLAAIKLEEGYTESIVCQAEHIKFIVGKGGANKDKIQKEFSVTLLLPNRDSTVKEAELTLLGKKANVQKARKEVEARLEVLKQTKDTTCTVPKKYHVQFVRRGKNGNILGKLQEEYAGTQIKVPAAGSDDETFTISGPVNCIEEVKAEILAYVTRFDNMGSLEVDLPCKNEDIRSLIGTGGANINAVQDEYKCDIKIDRAAEGEPDAICRAIFNGPKDKLEAARDALLALCPDTLEFDMPAEYHGTLLGQKGAGIRKLCEDLQITIKVPKRVQGEESVNTITLKGTDAKLKNALPVLDELRAKYDAEAEERYLESYMLELEVPVEFHSKLIGIKGANITKLRTAHNVNIQMPDRRNRDSDEAPENVIKIIGLQENAEAAARAVQQFCDDLMQTIEKEVEINHDTHRRIIGQRGRTVQRLMKEHSVEIRFPKDPADEKTRDIVTVSGMPECVDNAIEALTAMEEEFLGADGGEGDGQFDPRFKPAVAGQQAFRDQQEREQSKKRPQRNNQSYQAPTNAPWNQGGDNTAQNFPSLGNANWANSNMGAWANRR